MPLTRSPRIHCKILKFLVARCLAACWWRAFLVDAVCEGSQALLLTPAGLGTFAVKYKWRAVMLEHQPGGISASNLNKACCASHRVELAASSLIL